MGAHTAVSIRAMHCPLSTALVTSPRLRYICISSVQCLKIFLGELSLDPKITRISVHFQVSGYFLGHLFVTDFKFGFTQWSQNTLCMTTSLFIWLRFVRWPRIRFILGNAHRGLNKMCGLWLLGGGFRTHQWLMVFRSSLVLLIFYLLILLITREENVGFPNFNCGICSFLPSLMSVFTSGVLKLIVWCINISDCCICFVCSPIL